MKSFRKLRLILGDQLNSEHSWFKEKKKDVLYVMMEIKSESEYVKHHIQKILGFFGAMRKFSEQLEKNGFNVHYIKISDTNNHQNFKENLDELIKDFNISEFEYQESDEYRLDKILQNYSESLDIKSKCCSSEHFLTSRNEVKEFFGEMNYLMENFYRHMRKKHDILMLSEDEPYGNKWNYDHENRKKLPKDLKIKDPLLFKHDLKEIKKEIDNSDIKYFGEVTEDKFLWPLSRKEALKILDYFLDELIENYGPYQDAMGERSWTNFHSRISFALNMKMISPLEVIQKTEDFFYENDEQHLASTEGFIRQVLGWREFMRGVYWAKMPDYENENFFKFKNSLPEFFWSGETKMNCAGHSIKQSLEHAYAHHIQRLMVTGNLALLLQSNPDEVDLWYLGIYIDAIQWVEITNTRGMSQYADGGIIASKPYISSANYINKMSSYCSDCHYNHKTKTKEDSCPFNSLYWHFLETQKDKLKDNPRMRMSYNLLNKMDAQKKSEILDRAEYIIKQRDQI